MSKIVSGHNVISLWGIAEKARQLNKKFNNSEKKGLIISLISAFFIVIVFALVLNLTDKTLTNYTKTSVATGAVEEERTAFVPGQFVSEIIYRGYLGR